MFLMCATGRECLSGAMSEHSIKLPRLGWWCKCRKKFIVFNTFHERAVCFFFRFFFEKKVSKTRKKSSHTLPTAPFPYERIFRRLESLWWKIFFYFQKTFICNLSVDWIGNRLYGTRLIIIIIFNYTRSSFVRDETLKLVGEITSPSWL